MINTFYQYPKILDEFNISNDEKMTFIKIYDIFKLSMKNGWKDEHGFFVQVSRETIAKKIKRSIKTTIKYIKNLVRAGLLYEKWTGQGNCKKIYIPSFLILKKYNKKESKENKENRKQKKNKINFYNDKINKDNNKDNKDVELIENVKQIINENITEKEIIDVLKVAKKDIKVIKSAYTYTRSKNVKDLTAYLIQCIKHKWYEHIPISNKKIHTPNYNNYNNSNNSKFVNFKQRDLNFEALEKLERLQLKGKSVEQSELRKLVNMVYNS